MIDYTHQEYAGEVRTTSSTGGEKGVKRARFDLIPADPLWTLAELYGKGAEKYADRNWERGYEWSKSYGALMRHVSLFWQGVDLDDETGMPHLASVAWHAFALLEWATTHPEFDDRPHGSHKIVADWELDLLRQEDVRSVARDALRDGLENCADCAAHPFTD